MKIFTPVTFFCFLLSGAVVSAQFPWRLSEEIGEQIRYRQSPRYRLDIEANSLAMIRSAWQGKGTLMPLGMMMYSGSDAELGFTTEQKQHLSQIYDGNQNVGHQWFEKLLQSPTPEFTQVLEAMNATSIPDDPYFERATDEQKEAYREAFLAMKNFGVEALQPEVQSILTPEQVLQVRTFEMQVLPEIGYPSPSMFEPLDLTEEQKTEMNHITGEMKAEFERLALESAALQAEQEASVLKVLEGKSLASPEDIQKILSEARRQYVPSTELRNKADDLQQRGSALMALLKTRLMNELTDEQLDKMQKIMDETPQRIKELLAQARKQREQMAKDEKYIPGPESWKPGDGAPADFKMERQEQRFPRRR